MDDQVALLIDYFEGQKDVALAILFGSFGTLAERPESDIDIAVLCLGTAQRPVAISSPRRIAIIEALAERTGRTIDLIDMATADIPILGTVLTTGRTLLTRDPALRPTWHTRYLIDAADFLPYYERTLRERRAAWLG